MNYASMSDGDKEDERFKDEIGAADEARQRKSKRRKNKKSSKASRPPSQLANDLEPDEEEGVVTGSRQSARNSGTVTQSGKDGGEASPKSSPGTSDVDPGMFSQTATQGAALGLGVDQAVIFTDEEEPSPPPQSNGDGQSGSQRPSESKNPKKEMNKDFKELQETGRWGAISKREIYTVTGIGLLVVIAVVVVVVVLATGGDSSPTPATAVTPPPSPTPPPTARVVLTPEEQLTIIRAATIDNAATSNSTSLLPEIVSLYVDKAADSSASPVVRAASWIMYDDPWDDEEWLMIRYALAVLFYTTNGQSWSVNNGWLTDESACEWHGVRCDRFGRHVEEIDLSENNMSGSIPNEVGMIPTLISLWLRRNSLGGNVPSLALGALPSLSILYLDQNNLVGTIGPELAASGNLSKSEVGSEGALRHRMGDLTPPLSSFLSYSHSLSPSQRVDRNSPL